MSYTIKDMWLDPRKYPMKSPRLLKPKGIIIHNTSNDAPAKNEAAYMTGNNNEVSFHVVVDEKEVYQCVPFSRVAHHAGNYQANGEYIGLEIARSSSSDELYFASERNAIEYVAHVCIQYGWNPHKDVRFHREFYNTACPVRIPTSRYDELRSAIAKKMDEIKSGEVQKEPEITIEEVMTMELNPTTRKEIQNLNNYAVDKGIFAKKMTDADLAKMSDEDLFNKVVTYYLRKEQRGGTI